jgi:hypothetical protein
MVERGCFVPQTRVRIPLPRTKRRNNLQALALTRVVGVAFMWWLAYRRSGRIMVLLVKATSLAHARLLASISGLDTGTSFQEGHELDPPRARRVPQGVHR